MNQSFKTKNRLLQVKFALVVVYMTVLYLTGSAYLVEAGMTEGVPMTDAVSYLLAPIVLIWALYGGWLFLARKAGIE